jgi:hypothetical protein
MPERSRSFCWRAMNLTTTNAESFYTFILHHPRISGLLEQHPETYARRFSL